MKISLVMRLQIDIYFSERPCIWQLCIQIRVHKYIDTIFRIWGFFHIVLLVKCYYSFVTSNFFLQFCAWGVCVALFFSELTPYTVNGSQSDYRNSPVATYQLSPARKLIRLHLSRWSFEICDLFFIGRPTGQNRVETRAEIRTAISRFLHAERKGQPSLNYRTLIRRACVVLPAWLPLDDWVSAESALFFFLRAHVQFLADLSFLQDRNLFFSLLTSTFSSVFLSLFHIFPFSFHLFSFSLLYDSSFTSLLIYSHTLSLSLSFSFISSSFLFLS